MPIFVFFLFFLPVSAVTNNPCRVHSTYLYLLFSICVVLVLLFLFLPCRPLHQAALGSNPTALSLYYLTPSVSVESARYISTIILHIPRRISTSDHKSAMPRARSTLQRHVTSAVNSYYILIGSKFCQSM